MVRFSLIITLIIYTVFLVSAEPKKVVQHGKSFSLARPVLVVSEAGGQHLQQQVIDILTRAGTSATPVAVAKGFKTKIVIQRVGNIDNIREKDVLQIRVAPKKITISYTSDFAGARAVDIFGKLISGREIPGQEITDWGNSKIKRGVIDVSSRLMTIAEIEGALRHNREREIYLQLVDEDNWRLESSVFTVVDPTAKVYPSNGYYRFSQIASLMSKLNTNRFTLIPTIELMSPNKVFEQATGHSQFSVEGMRFVRAIIEECVEKLNCKVISVGTKSDQADERYIKFLEQVASRCGVRLVTN